MKLDFSVKDLRKILTFQENVLSGSRVVPCGGWTDGQTHEDSIAAFRIFAKPPRNR